MLIGRGTGLVEEVGKAPQETDPVSLRASKFKVPTRTLTGDSSAWSLGDRSPGRTSPALSPRGSSFPGRVPGVLGEAVVRSRQAPAAPSPQPAGRPCPNTSAKPNSYPLQGATVTMVRSKQVLRGLSLCGADTTVKPWWDRHWPRRHSTGLSWDRALLSTQEARKCLQLLLL